MNFNPELANELTRIARVNKIKIYAMECWCGWTTISREPLNKELDANNIAYCESCNPKPWGFIKKMIMWLITIILISLIIYDK